MRRTEKNLRRPIPESNNLMSIALERNSKSATKPKISNLENPLLLIKQKILRLEIAVENTVTMTMRNTHTELKQKTLNQSRRKRPRVWPFAVGIDVFLEIGVEVLEDEVEEGFRRRRRVVGGGGGVVVVVFGGFVDVLDFEEADDVDGLGEHLEEGDFAEGGRRDAFFVHLETGFLESDDLAGGFLFGFVDFAVCAFSYLLQFLVVFHFWNRFRENAERREEERRVK